MRLDDPTEHAADLDDDDNPKHLVSQMERGNGAILIPVQRYHKEKAEWRRGSDSSMSHHVHSGDSSRHQQHACIMSRAVNLARDQAPSKVPDVSNMSRMSQSDYHQSD